jgi:small subunit ribosomal protein S27Ae
MAAAKKGKDRKGKTTKGKKHPPQLYKAYDKGKRSHQFCPKCGDGVFMAAHKNRKSCGKCNYTEFKTK